MMYRCAPATSGSGKIVKKRGKSLRVDIHCHYLNTEAAAAVARHNPAQFDLLARFSSELTREVNAKQIQERAAKLTSIGQRLKDMDRMGIDVQAVSPAPHQTYYWCEPGEGAELARTVNERIAEIAAQWPERFVGLGSVPLQDAGLAVSELDYCVKQLGLRGVEINPSVNGLDLTDAKLGLDKFFSKVQDLDVLIFMHPVGFTHGERLADHYFNNVIGNPLETTVAASHLIFDGVMQRFPKLKVLLPHGGGYLAHGPCAPRPPGLQGQHKKEAFQLPGEVLFRLPHLRSRHAPSPGRALRRRSRLARHRLPLRHGRGGPGGIHRRSPEAVLS